MSKKLVIVALMAVLTIGVSVAQATPSRIDTLGQNTGLVYIQDDTNIFTNPAALSSYRNCLLFHMGGYDGGDIYALGGASLGLGEMITLGLIVGRNPDYEEGMLGLITGEVFQTGMGPLPLDFQNHWNGGAVPPANPRNYSNAGTNTASIAGLNAAAMNWVNPIDILLAVKLGNVSIGASWYMASGKHTSDYSDDVLNTSEELTARLQAWKFGVAASMGNISPEVWFHYAPLTVTSTWTNDTANTEVERELKARRINVGLRVPYKVNDNLSIVPAFEYANINGEVTISTDPDAQSTSVLGPTMEDLVESYTGSSINAGIGINYQIEKLLVASSIGLQWMKGTASLEVEGLNGTVDDTMKWIAIPVVGLGLEYQCTKILVFRGGIATTTIFSRSTDLAESDVVGSLNYSDESNITQQNTIASVGLGLQFGNLVIDLTAGDMIIANERGYNQLFTAMDFKYKF